MAEERDGSELSVVAVDPRPGFWDKCAHERNEVGDACEACGVALSRVSGLPMRALPNCKFPTGKAEDGSYLWEHEFAPERHYATSFAMVLVCKRCGFYAQSEIEPLRTVRVERKSWRKQRDKRALAAMRRWGYCAKWNKGDTHEPNHHAWAGDRVMEGTILCKNCGKGATVARIYAHPGGDGGRTDPQVWVRRFVAEVPE